MKKTVTHQIEVPQDKEESAIAILKSVEASITESSSQQLQAIAESLKPKVAYSRHTDTVGESNQLVLK